VSINWCQQGIREVGRTDPSGTSTKRWQGLQDLFMGRAPNGCIVRAAHVAACMV
jgi:hypothetical protein